MGQAFAEGAEAGGSRTILHNLRRAMIPWQDWSKFADDVAKWIAARQGQISRAAVGGSTIPDDQIEAFRQVGLGTFGRLLDDAAVDEIVRYLRGQAGYSGHHVSSSDGVPRGFGELALGHRYCAYTPDTVLGAPHLMALANRHDVLDFVERALGCVPTLYSVNAWWSFPAPGEPWPPYSQQFHRDDDDFRFFTLFAYLTDVTRPEDGATQLLAGSHTVAGIEGLVAGARESGRLDPDVDDPEKVISGRQPAPLDAVDRIFPAQVISMLGERGTCFIADTTALHRGLKPTAKARLIFWARYGLGPNSNTSDTDMPNGRMPLDRLGAAIPDTPRSRYVNRILVDF
jgi:hypothetical protein